MIVLVDHVALSSADFERDLAWLGALGYTVAFDERQVPNPVMKRELLSEYRPVHDLCLLTKPGSVGIELLNHGPVNPAAGYLAAVFENVSPEALPDVLPEESFRNELNPADPAVALRTLAVCCRDVEASRRFWQALGFRQAGDEQTLRFQSPLQKDPLSLRLMHQPDLKPSYRLDDAGFNCLALVSTTPERDQAMLREAGFAVTALEDFRRGVKNFRIFFTIGPSGELVEIIGAVPAPAPKRQPQLKEGSTP